MRNLRLCKKDYSCRTRTEWPVKHGRVFLVPCSVLSSYLCTVYCTCVHWTIHFFPGTRKTRCLAGHPVHTFANLQVLYFCTFMIGWRKSRDFVSIYHWSMTVRGVILWNNCKCHTLFFNHIFLKIYEQMFNICTD